MLNVQFAFVITSPYRVALFITGLAHRLSANNKFYDYLLNNKFLPEEQPGPDPIKNFSVATLRRNLTHFIGQKMSRDFF